MQDTTQFLVARRGKVAKEVDFLRANLNTKIEELRGIDRAVAALQNRRVPSLNKGVRDGSTGAEIIKILSEAPSPMTVGEIRIALQNTGLSIGKNYVSVRLSHLKKAGVVEYDLQRWMIVPRKEAAE